MEDWKSIKNKTKRSFKFAAEGLLYAFKTQRNLRIHFFFAFLIITAGIILKVNSLEFAVLVLTIAVVISMELFNTAIEAGINLVSPSNQPLAKIAKDLGAAAVLMFAIASIIIGLLIFGPRLLALVNIAFQQ
jgi:diacylglycerol kinase